MVRAFIMIKADGGDAEALLTSVTGLDHVVEANVVTGDFDVIVEAEAEEVYDVVHSAASEIRRIDGVFDTKTYICLE